MSQNSEFHNACEAWLQAALQLLQTKPMPGTTDVDVTLTSNGWQTRSVIIPDFVQLVLRNHDELTNLPEVDNVVHLISTTPALASVLLVDAGGNPIQSEASYKWWLYTALFSKFLFEYFRQSGTVTFISTVFEYIYNQLEQYIYRTEFTGMWLIHIRNLTLDDIERIQLDRNISLRRVTETEKVNIIKSSILFPMLPRPHSVSDLPSTFLEIHQSVGRPPSPNQQSINDLVQPVVLALRLIKPNPIGVISYQWSIPDQPFIMFAGFSTSLPLYPNAFMGDLYVLTHADSSTLPRLWKKTKKAYRDSKLLTVLTRFEDSYTRMKPQDKLIDCWTALEALFFLEDEFQDMGKSLALAASCYLGKDSSERSTIYHDLTRSHTLRSFYIHGERKKPKHPLDEMVTKTGEHLRNALRKRIEE